MVKDIKLSTAYTEEQLMKRVKELGKKINDHYGDREYIVVAVLKGSIYFLSDLTRELSNKIIIDFMAISSYFGHEKKSFSAKVVLDINTNIRGKDVLIVEDIVDSGETLQMVLDMFKIREPKSVKVVSLLVKDIVNKDNRKVNVDWYGFNVKDKFVIGYGLDYQNNYRNLNKITYLETEGE